MPGKTRPQPRRSHRTDGQGIPWRDFAGKQVGITRELHQGGWTSATSVMCAGASGAL